MRSLVEKPPEPNAVTLATSTHLGAFEWGLIVLQSMLWGSAFFWIAFARNDIPPITITAARLIPAIAILLLVLAIRRQRLPADLATWAHCIVFAAFNNVIPFILLILAQKDVSTGLSAVFNATAPLFTLILARLFGFDGRFSWTKALGIIAGISGVAVIAGPALAGGSSVSGTSYLELIGAPLCYALAMIYVRTFLMHVPSFPLATAQMTASFAFAAPLSLLIEQPWTLSLPPTKAILAVIAMGVFGSALASMCHFTIMKRAGPTNSLLVTLLLPVTPIVLGSLFLGEHLSTREWVGTAVIALALVIIDGRIFSLWRR